MSDEQTAFIVAVRTAVQLRYCNTSCHVTTITVVFACSALIDVVVSQQHQCRLISNINPRIFEQLFEVGTLA